MAQIRSKQIQDFLTTVNWGTVTDKQIANASAIDARFSVAEASIEDAMSVQMMSHDEVNASIDSVELALSAEIVARGLDVDAEESRAIAAEGSLNTKVSTETSRALAAEAQISSDLATEISNRIADVDAEETRAMGVEAQISSDLANEISNRIADVDAEETRAMGVEAQISAALSSEIVARNADVDAEESRAIAAEGSLNTKIAAETTRATIKEGQLDASVDSLEVALAAEISATDADFTSINTRATGIEGNLSTEKVDRIAGDASLATAIGTEKGRIDAILAGSAADLDQFAEVITYLNSVDTVNDLDLTNYMATANGKFSGLDASVNSLETAVSADYNALSGDIASEEARAIAAEGSLNTKITNLSTEVVNEVASIDTRLGSVSGDLVNSVDSLELALSAEIVARGLDVDAEESRAIAAEGSLNTKVGSLNTVVTDNYNSLSTDITNAQNNAENYAYGLVSTEQDARIAGDNALQSNIDTLSTEVQNNYSTLDGAIWNEQSRAIAAEDVLQGNIDTISTEVVNEVASIDARLGLVSGDLVNSVDSLELALSAEISNRTADVNAEESRAIAAEGSINTAFAAADSIEKARAIAAEGSLDTKVSTETARAIAKEGQLDASVDSLEAAVSANYTDLAGRISTEHAEHVSTELVLDGKINTEKGRIDAILLASSANTDTFAEVVSLINAVDLTNDNAFAAYALATDNSIDSLEVALSAEIAATNADVTGINNSIDSLEVALSAEIAATNADVIEINSSIDSLQTAMANEEAARLAGDTYIEQVVTGVASGKSISVPMGVRPGSDSDLEVFVNGLKVAYTTANGVDFNLTISYDLEATDKVTVLGVVA